MRMEAGSPDSPSVPAGLRAGRVDAYRAVVSSTPEQEPQVLGCIGRIFLQVRGLGVRGAAPQPTSPVGLTQEGCQVRRLLLSERVLLVLV